MPAIQTKIKPSPLFAWITIRCCFFLATTVLLYACGTLTTEPPLNATETNAPIFTTVAKTATALSPTLSSLPTISFLSTSQVSLSTPIEQSPTFTFSPTDTPLATSLTPTITQTPYPLTVIKELRVVYISKGDVYIQDGDQQPVRLTHSSQASSSVLISDDGQKIAFSCGTNRWCTVSADGTGERTLVTQEQLISFGDVYSHECLEFYNLGFAPNSHQLLFFTWIRCKGGEGHIQRNDDLWLADTDTGMLRQLRGLGQGGNFLAAPNGNWIAVQTVDHIDVIDMQGQSIYRNLVTHAPIDDYYGIWWAKMFWTSNSSELIVVPTDIPPGTGYAMLSTVWRYSLNSGAGIEIKLNPTPVYDAYAVSPDGNWLAYTYDPDAGVGENEIRGVYLGNLHDGTSQLLYVPPVNERTGYPEISPIYYDGWSPDSMYYLVHDMDSQIFLVSIRGEFVPLGRWRSVTWIDNRRYLLNESIVGEVGKQKLFKVTESLLDVFVFLER